MTFVPVKSAETQANAMILFGRELLVKQQTQAINALRGHANEFGAVAAKGTSNRAPTLLQAAFEPRGRPHMPLGSNGVCSATPLGE
jgi:transposase